MTQQTAFGLRIGVAIGILTCVTASAMGGGTNACCLPSGECTDGTPNVTECMNQGGQLFLANTSCTPNPCAHPTGACCEDFGECSERTAASCLFIGGRYQGHATSCDTDACIDDTTKGACCTSSGNCHIYSDESQCTDSPINGLSYPGSTCLPAPCGGTTGACCTAEGCFAVTSQECTILGGSYDGDNTTCDPIACPSPPGACCFSGGNCSEITRDDCEAQDGVYHGNHTLCSSDPCGTLGACCSPFGGCAIDDADDCAADSGIYLADQACSLDPCPPPMGACCDDFGECSERTAASCLFIGGRYQGHATGCDTDACIDDTTKGACCTSSGNCHIYSDESQCTDSPINGLSYPGSTCLPAPCGGTTGACCTAEGCFAVTSQECTILGGSYDGDNTTCDPVVCPTPTGACCLDEAGFQVAGRGVEACLQLHEIDCLENYVGEYLGDGTTCDEVLCNPERVDISKKGSLLVLSDIELEWTLGPVAGGDVFTLRKDTVISLLNDYPGEVHVQMYFINGDPPRDAVFSSGPVPVLISEAEPGWNWVDCQVLLTPDQPDYWSAATGNPLGCQPFGILDPDLGNGPGRPNPDAADGTRVLRGFIIAFAVDSQGQEINWNHLSAKATIVDYSLQAGWEYSAWAFQALAPSLIDQGVFSPGILRLDGVEYDNAFDMLLFDFFAAGSAALSIGGNPVSVDTDLTLHLVSADLRQETEGPVITKAHFDIWNMNERKLSNTRRCITCWDQALLSQFNAPNNFLLGNLQSDKGKARIDGKQANECEENCFRDEMGEPLAVEDLLDLLGDLFNQVEVRCSEDAALLGVAAKILRFTGTSIDYAGSELVGMGTESAEIRFDAVGPPGTLREEAFHRIGRTPPRLHDRLEPAKIKPRE